MIAVDTNVLVYAHRDTVFANYGRRTAISADLPR
jgi:predicted nucleic acid-binding protein